jgi:hypothetical protein
LELMMTAGSGRKKKEMRNLEITQFKAPMAK